MTRIKVWDVPTRLFHWLLAGAFLAAFGIAQFVSDKDPLFSVHALLGLVIGLMALLRIIWGFAGSRYAKFSSFIFSPGELTGYMRDAFSGKGKRYIGHNPGSGYAIFAMLVLLLGIVTTGLLSQSGEIFEGLHEFFAYAMIAMVTMHILGVLWHTIRHKENITFSMVTGTKEGVQNEGILSARPLAGIAFLLLTGLWSAGLFTSYDQNTRQTVLPVIGTAVQLSENENKAEKHKGVHKKHQKHDDD
ncbi:MAG: cytochrome b/b6 domain-containing protein [Nitrospirae bacterium]|nr:cytochrome b/b6 domain-containing protein [Nitrospirota bacterium]